MPDTPHRFEVQGFSRRDDGPSRLSGAGGVGDGSRTQPVSESASSSSSEAGVR